MIKIVRNNIGKFEVDEGSDGNGQFLGSSLQQFERRQGCYKNIVARMKNWNSHEVSVLDTTRKKPVLLIFKSGNPKPTKVNS